MKKYSTNYFEWIIYLLINLILVGVLAYSVYWSITLPKKYSMDLSPYLLSALSIVVFVLYLWETIVLFDFIIKDVNGTIYFDSDKLIVTRSGSKKEFEFKDLQEIEFFGPRTGSKSITTWVTYAKLTFKNKILVVTSFTMHNRQIIQHLGNKSSRAITRERRFFELIKV